MNRIKKRRLGNNLEGSSIGLGCMGMSFRYGTTKFLRLEENLGAASVNLSNMELMRIEEALSIVEFQGVRFPETSQRKVDNSQAAIQIKSRRPEGGCV